MRQPVRNSRSFLSSVVIVLALVLGLGAPVRVQAAAPARGAADGPRVDRTLGEEEQIENRLEWFFGTRRAGAATDADRVRMRLEGVRQTRAALDRQAALRAEGKARQFNVWVPKGPAASTFGGWTFGTVSGRVSTIAADWSGGVLYLGSASGGLWKSTNDGLSWTQLFDTAGTMTVGTVTIDPNDSDVVWVGTGENNQGCESYFGIGLLRSGDGGLSWEARNGSGVDGLDELASFANVLVDPRDSSKLVTGGRIRGCADGSASTGGIFTTDDAGLTWAERLSGVEVYEIARDPAVLDVLWAASSQGVYKSVDNGASWVRQTASGLPSSNVGRSELAVAPSDGNVVYALFSSGPSFWRTTDGGATWSQMSSGSNACDGQCGYNMVLRVHDTDPDTVYRGTVHVFKSTNGGASWTDLSNNWGSSQKVHQDTHHLLMDPDDPDSFYVGCDGGVWKTADGGSTFLDLNGNLNLTQFYAIGIVPGDTGKICGGAQDNSSLVRTTDDTWDLQAVTGDGFVCQFNPQNPDYAYITSYPSGGYPNVWRSTSGPFGPFHDITGSGSGVNSGDRSNWVTPYIIDPTTPNILYLGTQRVYRSTSSGSSWTPTGPSDMTGGSGSLTTLDVNPGFPGHVLAGSNSGRVWRTTDSASTWTDITSGLPSRSINDVAGDPTNPDRAFAVVGGFGTAHLWEWNAGAGWTARDGGLPDVPTNTVLMLDASDLVVGNDVGVFRSYDGGQTFTPFMDGLPQGLVVTDLKFDSLQQTITAGTYGRGAWQVQTGPPTPLVVYDSIELPLVEVDGDGDEHVEPGETWSVRVVLRNGGGADALDVHALVGTATPGVSVIDGSLSFGDLPPGGTAPSLVPAEFVIDPSFPCSDSIVFDVTNLTSSDPPAEHAAEPGAFSIQVLDDREPPVISTPVDEDFDPQPTEGWTHEAVDPGLAACSGVPYFDQWQVLDRGDGHGLSYHCGGGPAGAYTKYDFSWLYHAGRDSENGPGIEIPADAVEATLTIEHWYETTPGADGAQVLIDAVEDGQDVYVPLEPVGGYPGGALATGNCNGLEGLEAFQGSSGGWVTSTFDLTQWRGHRVYVAFVFASDRTPTSGEGWYIDRVTVSTHPLGDPICQVAAWPGSVADSLTLDPAGGDAIAASWSASCNDNGVPGQTYSILVGDLDQLHAEGAYGLAVLDGICDRTSPAVFTPGPANEFYLVVPNTDGREGGAGTDSAGNPRPVSDGTCGVPREAGCP